VTRRRTTTGLLALLAIGLVPTVARADKSLAERGKDH
jgi:hypothetical protein